MAADLEAGRLQLDAEQANLHAALEWSVVEEESGLALRLVRAMAPYWRLRGRLSEGRQWLERVLVLPGEPSQPGARTELLLGLGLLAAAGGDLQRAQSAGEECQALAARSGDLRMCARAFGLLACVQDPAMLERSVELARNADDDWCLAISLGFLGWLNSARGEPIGAQTLLAECLAVSRRDDNLVGAVIGLLGLGHGALRAGDLQKAQEMFDEAWTVAAGKLADPFFSAASLACVSQLSAVRGEHEEAYLQAGEAAALARGIGADPLLCVTLCVHADHAVAADDPDSAWSVLEEATSAAGRIGPGREPAVILLALGSAAMGNGVDGARDLLEQARATAQEEDDKILLGRVLHRLGKLARRDRDVAAAVATHIEAIRLQYESSDLLSVVDSLEGLAAAAVEQGKPERAYRLFGAADSLRHKVGYVRAPTDRPTWEADVASARAALSAEQATAAWRAGSVLSVSEAVSYARSGRGSRPASGWESLTSAELNVVQLAARRLTNPEIASSLCISPRTVQAHLAHVYDKLGVRSRRNLARLAVQRGLTNDTT